MEKEKIYIIVPVYNVEVYLERCVNSILNQTHRDFELILINDGSRDSSGTICDRYAAQDERVNVIHQENSGVSAARNVGLQYALQAGDSHRDWLVFIDSDDFVHPLYLEYLYTSAKSSGANISSCGFVSGPDLHIQAEPMEPLNYDCVSPEDYWAIRGSNAVVPWGKLYRLCLLKNVVYPAGKIHEDTYTTYKIMFSCPRIALFHTPLYYYFTNPQSITASVWSPDRMAVLDALDEELAFFRENGYTRAYRPTVEFMYWSTVRQLMLLRAQSPKYDSHISEMKAWRKRAFRLYVEEFSVFSAVSLWFRTRFLDPAKRVLRKESLFSFLKRKLSRKLRKQ